jgi:hypothetical protein
MAEILEYDKMFYKNFEPKLNNRFIMEINGIDSYLVKTMSRPTVSSEIVELDHINVKRKIKGKTTWEDVTISLYDPIVPSGAQQVMDWIRQSHEALTGRDGYAAFYKKDVNFYALGPVGDKVEQWTLKGAFITSANFGDMDWAGNELVSIEVTLAYDYAILEY